MASKIDKLNKQKRAALGSVQNVEADVKLLDKIMDDELSNNPEYSLQPNPLNTFDMSNEEVAFIKYYIEFRSIPLAAELSHIDLDVAKQFYTSYAAQYEIKRINKALNYRRFHHKILSIDALGGWLSSLITDENVPVADRLKTTDKLKVASMLIGLNDFKRDAYNDPSKVLDVSIEDQLKDASIDTIKQLLLTVNKKDEKQKAIDDITKLDILSAEEIAYLNTLSADELLKFLNNMNKEGDKNGN